MPIINTCIEASHFSLRLWLEKARQFLDLQASQRSWMLLLQIQVYSCFVLIREWILPLENFLYHFSSPFFFLLLIERNVLIKLFFCVGIFFKYYWVNFCSWCSIPMTFHAQAAGKTDAFNCVELFTILSEVERVENWRYQLREVMGISSSDSNSLIGSMEKVLLVSSFRGPFPSFSFFKVSPTLIWDCHYDLFIIV